MTAVSAKAKRNIRSMFTGRQVWPFTFYFLKKEREERFKPIKICNVGSDVRFHP